MKNNHLKFPLSSYSCEFRFFIKWPSSPLKSLMEKSLMEEQKISLKQDFREVKKILQKKRTVVLKVVTMTEKAEGMVSVAKENQIMINGLKQK